MPAPWITPFLKWAGGKRWLVQSVSDIFPAKFNRYIEPFLGGGSMFFALQPEHAILSDANKELITTYRTVASHPREILEGLTRFQQEHSTDTFYRVRKIVPVDPVEQAVRFIYLNRTCYNGLYRVNQKGEFNVPIGTKLSVLMPTDDWDVVAGLLAGSELLAADFESVIDRAERGDFVFSDPPYTVKHNHNGFIKYNENIFAWSDQERLCEALRRAKQRGVKIVCTNADHESIRTLYQRGFTIQQVDRASVIGGGIGYRGRISELIIR